jgi:hypothetical protein
MEKSLGLSTTFDLVATSEVIPAMQYSTHGDIPPIGKPEESPSVERNNAEEVRCALGMAGPVDDGPVLNCMQLVN